MKNFMQNFANNSANSAEITRSVSPKILAVFLEHILANMKKKQTSITSTGLGLGFRKLALIGYLMIPNMHSNTYSS